MRRRSLQRLALAGAAVTAVASWSAARWNAGDGPSGSGFHAFAAAEPASLRSILPDDCTACHELPLAHASRHGGVTSDSCGACHDANALGRPKLLAATSEAATCAACHTRDGHPQEEGRVSHATYTAGQCSACHEIHPRAMPEHRDSARCETCHAEIAQAIEHAPSSHCAVEDGCLACHEPHASEQPALLRANAAELCLGCHPAIKATIDSATVGHDAVLNGERCLHCHDPHASAAPSLLRGSERERCLACHAQPVTDRSGQVVAAVGPEPVGGAGRTARPAAVERVDGAFVHGAIEHGGCSGCHAIHGASHPRLLREPSPTDPRAAMDRDERSFALCFGCHDANLLSPSGETGFRDGTRNLHAIHLRGDRNGHLAGATSRSCGSCHAVHSATTPHLVADRVRFEGSSWVMPMRFEPTSTGGSCAPGCHERLGYRRPASSDHQPPADRPLPSEGAVP